MVESLAEKRRKYFNEEFGKQSSGISMKSSDKKKLMKKIWQDAKRKFK